jgi:hypothetical protein
MMAIIQGGLLGQRGSNEPLPGGLQRGPLMPQFPEGRAVPWREPAEPVPWPNNSLLRDSSAVPGAMPPMPGPPSQGLPPATPVQGLPPQSPQSRLPANADPRATLLALFKAYGLT